MPLEKLMDNQPPHIHHWSLMGHQTYLSDPDEFKQIQKAGGELFRLGSVRENLEEVEPILRDSDLLLLNIRSIQMSDAPAVSNGTPNGFSAEEACQIMRYAGLSDQTSAIGIFGFDPSNDIHGQSAQLIAQMLWCAIDGFYNRKKDYPMLNKKDFIRYTTYFDNEEQKIVFLKSRKSDRWWMEVPVMGQNKQINLVPCSYADYESACQEEIPERWIKATAEDNN